MSLTRIIKEKALELGFVDVGVATAEPFTLYAARDRRPAGDVRVGQKPEPAGFGAETWTSSGSSDPSRFIPEVKSLIVVTDSYFEEDFPPSLVGKIGRCYLKGLFCPEENLHSQRRREFKKFLLEQGIKTVYGPAPARHGRGPGRSHELRQKLFCLCQ